MSKEGAFRYIRVHSGTFGFIRVHLVSFATHEMLGKRNKNVWELLLVGGSFCATAFSFYPPPGLVPEGSVLMPMVLLWEV